MAVTDEEVRQVAMLARLAVDDGALPSLAAELRGILSHMEQLRGFRELPPALEPGTGPMPLRDDRPGSPLGPSVVAAIAPVARDGYFLVPQVVVHDGPPGAGDGSA